MILETQELIDIQELGLQWNMEQREIGIMRGIATAEDLVNELEEKKSEK